MRCVLLLASSLACTLACGRMHDSGTGPTPDPPADNRGGGPRQDEPMVIEPPSGSAPQQGVIPRLPGMGDGGAATESNGGSGAGATGSKGEGETLQNGTNPKKRFERPDSMDKKFDLGPGNPHPKTP